MAVKSTADLVQESFDSITLGEPYATLIGSPAPAFAATIHGEQGAGKSTFALGLAYHLVPHAIVYDGSVLYVSAEEGHGATAAGKASRLGVDHERLLISDAQDVEAIKEEAKEHDAKYIIIDSGNRVDPGSTKLLELLEWCQERAIGLLFVLRQTKEGQYKGASGLAYDPEIEIEAYKDDEGDERARTHKNRHHPAPRDISIPMEPGEIGTPAGFDTARRENPDCENWDQAPKEKQQRCKAMFANLHNSGEYDPEELDGTDVGEEETPQGEAVKAEGSKAETGDESGAGDEGGDGPGAEETGADAGEEAADTGEEGRVDLDETENTLSEIKDQLANFL
jgi:hypothetical protein